MAQQTKTYKEINLLTVGSDLIWGLGGEVGVSFELFPKNDLRMCASGEHPSYVLGFSRLLSSLPSGSGITYEVEIGAGASSVTELSKSVHLNGCHPLLKKIADQKAQVFTSRGRKISLFSHFWLGDINPLKLKLLPSFMVSKKQMKSSQERLDKNISTAEKIAELLTASFSSISVKSKRLTSDEIIERYWKILNPSKSQDAPHPKILPRYSLRSQLACVNCHEDAKYYYADGHYHTVVSFYQDPEEFYLGEADNLIDILPYGSRYIFSALVPDQEELLQDLKKRRGQTVSLVEGEKGSKAKDYESREKERGLDALISSCVGGGERLYVVWSCVILRSSNLEELSEWQRKLVFAMREIFSGSQALVEDCLHRRFFLASLPFSGHLAPRRKLMLGSTASALAANSRPWSGTESPGMILLSRSGEPVNFDIFDGGTPRHGIVIGTTGSGKSFCANMLLIALLTNPKLRALVIDIGGSFRRLTEVLDGAYFDIRLDERYAINPILPKSSLLREDGTFDPEVLGAQTSLLAKITQTSSGPGRLVLEKAIERAFRRCEEPLLSNVLAVLREESWDDNLKAQAQAIANELMPFCEGVYSLLLSRPSRIRPFERQITAFDLAGLKEHKSLQSIMVSVIAFSLNRQFADKSIKKVIVIDEAWEFFNDAQSSELVSKLYRQARKQNAAIVTMSQSPVEFLSSMASTAMVSNKYWTMALKMASGHELLEKFGFSDQAIERSKSMQMSPKAFSEVMIQFGDNPARIARIAPTSLEYWIATTNANECAQEERLRRDKNLSAIDSILEMAEKEPVREW